MTDAMKSAAIRALLATLISMAGSLAVVRLAGMQLAGLALWIPVICCLVTALPVSFFTFYQSDRLRRVNGELRKTQEELRHALDLLGHKASHDSMTGLLNRENFFSLLDNTREMKNRGALLLIDVDHFKSINDRFGHLAGDEALLKITDAVQGVLRTHDLVGRVGGEEFGVFLRGASAEEAGLIGERLRRAVESIEFHPADGEPAKLTISIGGAMCWPESLIADVMREADRQLYTAKSLGRNRFVMARSAGRLAA